MMIEEKRNFDDVFLRQVIVGMLGFLKDRFKWTNRSDEHGEVSVVIPVHYSLTGDNRYILDSFYDDMSDKRVEMNTDSIPRMQLSLINWDIKKEEYTNPNIWININKVEQNELKQVSVQTKAVPVKLTFTLELLVDNEIDVFKAWQAMMHGMYSYGYFSFDYLRVPINAILSMPDGATNPIARDYKFGDNNIIKSQYTVDVHTFFPIFDFEHQLDANDKIQWVLQIWQKNSNQMLNERWPTNSGYK